MPFFFFLQHHNTNTTHLLVVGEVLLVHAAGDRGRPVVVQVEVQLAVAGAELERFQEQGVVVESEGVEHVEAGLHDGSPG